MIYNSIHDIHVLWFSPDFYVSVNGMSFGGSCRSIPVVWVMLDGKLKIIYYPPFEDLLLHRKRWCVIAMCFRGIFLYHCNLMAR